MAVRIKKIPRPTNKQTINTLNDCIFVNLSYACTKFDQYKKMQKKPGKWFKPWHMGTYLWVLIEGHPINTKMTMILKP